MTSLLKSLKILNLKALHYLDNLGVVLILCKEKKCLGMYAHADISSTGKLQKSKVKDF